MSCFRLQTNDQNTNNIYIYLITISAWPTLLNRLDFRQ